MEAIKVKEVVEAVGGKLLCGDENTEITSVCIDSREACAGCLFVPIIGERVDAHKFIGQVFASGAAATLTSAGEVEAADQALIAAGKLEAAKVYILVEDTEKALGALSVYYKQRFLIPFIGITGSVGKTSTKEMIAAALATKYNVLKTAGNQNSNIGVPLTLFRIEHQHQIAVIEMGISEFGEMSELADFVHPNTLVVTNIGVAHLAQFKTRENILAEKLTAAKHFGANNVLYLNGDNDMLAKAMDIRIDMSQAQLAAGCVDFEKLQAVLKDAQVHYFSTEKNMNFYAKDIHIKDGRQCFTFVSGDKETKVSMLQLGIHTVYNAVVALAIAMQYGIDPETAKEGVENYTGIAMRQQVNHMPDSIKIIDDTYNASPDSIISGVQVLMSMDNDGRKIASLADVLELGEASLQCHYDTGKTIAGMGIDEVVTVGEMMKALVKAINDTNPHIVTHAFDTNAEAAAYIKSVICAGDALLCKGSRGMHQEEIVQAVKAFLNTK